MRKGLRMSEPDLRVGKTREDRDLKSAIDDRVLRVGGGCRSRETEAERSNDRRELPARGLRRGRLRRGEFPQPVQKGRAAPHEKRAPAALREDCRQVDGDRPCLARPPWIPLLAAAVQRGAPLRQRTAPAERISRQTDRLPQIHESRDRIARPAPGEKRKDSGENRLPVGTRSAAPGKRIEPRDDAGDVRVGGGDATSEGEGGDGGGGVGPEPRQRLERFRVVGKPATVLANDQTRRFPQIPGTAVISQARPRRQHRVLPGAREASEIRKAAQEAVVPIPGRGHGGLLEHHLRDPDPVRVRRATPGEGALLPSKPGQQLFAEEGCLHASSDELTAISCQLSAIR